MYSLLKISDHEHSGRLRPHEHTSYLPLIVLVAIVGVLLIIFSSSTIFAADPPPQSGSVGLTGVMPSTPPKTAATITTPTNGQHFSSLPITVSGSCPDGTFVEIYKNNIFAGSTPCDSNGDFSASIDLLYGQNSLVAQVYDVLNQAGPQSNTVTVFYDASPTQLASIVNLDLSGAQLLLSTNAVYHGTFPGQVLNVPISIIGGVAPFAVNVDWGDSSNKVIPRGDNSVFNASHVYQKPGIYKITLQGSDIKQQVAYLTVAAIVNGQPSVIATTNVSTISKSGLSKLLVLWPLYAIVVTLVVSFWIGERHEKHVLTAAAQLPTLGNSSHQPV
jgi:hypothetical protein